MNDIHKIIEEYRKETTPIIKALLEQGKEEQAFYVAHGLNILLNINHNYSNGLSWQMTDYTGRYASYPSKYKKELGYDIFDPDYPQTNEIWNIKPKS